MCAVWVGVPYLADLADRPTVMNWLLLLSLTATSLALLQGSGRSAVKYLGKWEDRYDWLTFRLSRWHLSPSWRLPLGRPAGAEVSISRSVSSSVRWFWLILTKKDQNLPQVNLVYHRIKLSRFYRLCLETRAGDTLCNTDRFPNGRSLTIPAFSNICRSVIPHIIT